MIPPGMLTYTAGSNQGLSTEIINHSKRPEFRTVLEFQCALHYVAKQLYHYSSVLINQITYKNGRTFLVYKI